jgi:hypothetical protein
MVNDIRLRARESLDAVRHSTEAVNEHLPQIVEKTRLTTETLADLAQDIRQLKELAGVSQTARDKSLVAYASEVLDRIEGSGGTIGQKKTFGSGLKNGMPASEWVVGARKEALLLTVLAQSKHEMLQRLAKTKFGSPWYIQFGEQEPTTLEAWIRANHPGSKALPIGKGDAPATQ